MLYFIGLGLGNEKDITVRGLEAVKSCEKVFLENYTSVLGVEPKKASTSNSNGLINRKNSLESRLLLLIVI